MAKKKLPEFIKSWVKDRYPRKYWDQVTDDIIDVMAGNRPGNNYEERAAKEIMKAYNAQ